MQELSVFKTASKGGSYKCSVLIADDARGDRFLLKRAIRVSMPGVTVIGEVEDGAKLISYLSGEGQYADRELHPFPDLVFLDLRMPLMDGFDVLAWLQKQALPQLKVVVLAGSLDSEDRQRVLDLGVEHAYLKPWRYEALAGVLKVVEADLIGNNR